MLSCLAQAVRTAHLRAFLLALVGCTVVGGLIPAGAGAVSVADVERQEVAKINAYRHSHGLVALKIDVKLTRAAEWMSADLAHNNYFSHTDSLGRDPFARIATFGYPSNTWRGENLAAGNEDPDATFEQWRNSPEHNENMLNSHYTVIGIARVYDPNSTYRYYWTTDFGSQLTSEVNADGTGSDASSPSSSSSNSGSFSTTTHKPKPKPRVKRVKVTTVAQCRSARKHANKVRTAAARKHARNVCSRVKHAKTAH